eukprot:gene6610-biopygen3294
MALIGDHSAVRHTMQRWPTTIFTGSNSWQPGAVLARNEGNETLGWISNIGDTSGTDFNYGLISKRYRQLPLFLAIAWTWVCFRRCT